MTVAERAQKKFGRDIRKAVWELFQRLNITPDNEIGQWVADEFVIRSTAALNAIVGDIQAEFQKKEAKINNEFEYSGLDKPFPDKAQTGRAQ